jgi:transposase-like protein
MFIRAKISKYNLKKIIKHFCVDIPSSKTAILTKINRNTINRYYNIFRKIIYSKQVKDLEKIFGKAELDKSYFGAKRGRGISEKLKRGRGTLKQPVFGIFERSGRVYTEIVPDCKKYTLQAIILGKIEKETVIYSDGWRGYNGLVDVGYDKHYRVNHNKEFSKGNGVHINGIESFWSFCKRRMTKFNGVKNNFELHLKECEWRWKRNGDNLEKELTKQVLKITQFIK